MEETPNLNAETSSESGDNIVQKRKRSPLIILSSDED